MELKSLFLGLIFTLGIFCLKSCIGLSYVFTRVHNLKVKIFFISGSVITYFLVFFFSYLILKGVDLINYYTLFSEIFRSGMYIHILIATGLIVWGIYLLRDRPGKGNVSKAFLLLIIPCPVCATVIFITIAFLLTYFPHASLLAISGSYLVFVAMATFSVLTLTLWDKGSKSSPETTLGTAMLLIAIYFILSIIIMPQFSDIGNIYRIAAYKGEKASLNIGDILFLLATMATFFTAGYLIKRRKIRRERDWI